MSKAKRVAFTIGPAEARLVGRLAREWKMAEADVLRLAVWAYVVPLAPTLKAPAVRADGRPMRLDPP